MPEADYRVDTTHLGVRSTVVVVMVIGVLLGLLIMPVVERSLGLRDLGAVCARWIVALALGVGMASGAEHLLRQVWPSGRSLHVDQCHIVLRQRWADDIVMQWGEPIEVMAWHFTVSQGRGLVPKGWYCLACRLNQSDAVMTLYTFMPPDQAKLLSVWTAFDELPAPRRRRLVGRDPGPPPRESPHVARLRVVERERWQDGAELQPLDFQGVMEQIAARVEGWPPERKT